MRSIYGHTDAPFIVTDSRTSESIKYLCNIFHAVKIGFANEIGAVLKAVGVDAREAMRVFCEDKVLNISPAYLETGFCLWRLLFAEGFACVFDDCQCTACGPAILRQPSQ